MTPETESPETVAARAQRSIDRLLADPVFKTIPSIVAPLRRIMTETYVPFCAALQAERFFDTPSHLLHVATQSLIVNMIREICVVEPAGNSIPSDMLRFGRNLEMLISDEIERQTWRTHEAFAKTTEAIDGRERARS